MIKINTREWKFILLISCIIVIITSAPMMVGILSAPEGKTFLGYQRINSADTSVYYSWIEQGKEGHLLFKSLYTSEDQVRYIFDPFWLGVGLFAKIFSLSAFVSYQLIRIFLIPIFLAVAYMFISFFFSEERKRKICFLLLIFSSGLGGLASAVITTGGLNTALPSMDLWAVETVTFLELYHSPHFLASLTLTISTFLLILLAFEKQKIILSFLAGLTALLLFQFHPFNVPIIWGIIGGYVIAEIIRRRTLKFSLVKYYLVLIAISSPAVAYHFWSLQTFESRTQYALQNNLFTPPFYNFLFTYGFVGLLACIGIFFSLKKSNLNNPRFFLISWIVIQFVISKLPFINFQIKSLEGLHFALVIMAAYGLFHLKDCAEKNKFCKKYFFRNQIALILIAIPLISFSNLIILLRDVDTHLMRDANFFQSDQKISAAKWLRSNSPPDSIILSTEINGNLIPALAVRTVYLGHPISTANSNIKQEQIKSFFEKYDDKVRSAFLRIHKIDYLFYGPEEREYKNFNPGTVDYIEKIYQNEEVAIYAVNKN